jgi:hypothetical protein
LEEKLMHIVHKDSVPALHMARNFFHYEKSVLIFCTKKYTLLIWYDIFNRSWVETRWQQYITHLHTNSTHNTEKGKIRKENWEVQAVPRLCKNCIENKVQWAIEEFPVVTASGVCINNCIKEVTLWLWTLSKLIY